MMVTVLKYWHFIPKHCIAFQFFWVTVDCSHTLPFTVSRT